MFLVLLKTAVLKLTLLACSQLINDYIRIYTISFVLSFKKSSTHVLKSTLNCLSCKSTFSKSHVYIYKPKILQTNSNQNNQTSKQSFGNNHTNLTTHKLENIKKHSSLQALQYFDCNIESLTLLRQPGKIFLTATFEHHTRILNVTLVREACCRLNRST